MTKCKCSIETNDTKSLKEYLKIIGNNYFDQYAEDGLEERIKFEMCTIYLYYKYRSQYHNVNVSIEEYDGEIALIEECIKLIQNKDKYKKVLENNDNKFRDGCTSLYKHYKEQKYIKENQNTNFAPPTGISLVSIVYFISRMFLLDWIKDAQLNRNKIYVPIAFTLSILLFSIASALMLHAAGISTLPFLKNVNLPTGANVIAFLPIHFSIAIVFALVSTAFLGLGIHKLNNAKTVESTINLVFKKVESNALDNSCIDCNYSRLHRRLVPILASISVALVFVAFIFEVQALLQSNDFDRLGMGYLNKASFPLHLGTFLCIVAAIGLSALSIYKYFNKEDKKMIQGDKVELEGNCEKVNESEKKDCKNNSENKEDPNFLGQNVAKLLILCKLPRACIEKFNAQEPIS
ncbi:MAG: hypothetical protein sL5_05140 [Candidatus Mesenet longicola]|uniref:Uncharacterized protein n=1 Tax=Candidatus Mesenet longicola TaxID=1892558 RepID=A0A8J3HXT1_9RICK|nr:MAG: hypothetical protein sGL2_05410 [Candidatus Mesenet longicola]GHM59521.1 MAG: hypothetical protein sL5_05140 [Candidatus Mesenet longicola]